MMTRLPICQIESTSPFSTFGVKFAGLAVGSVAGMVAADTSAAGADVTATYDITVAAATSSETPRPCLVERPVRRVMIPSLRSRPLSARRTLPRAERGCQLEIPTIRENAQFRV